MYLINLQISIIPWENTTYLLNRYNSIPLTIHSSKLYFITTQFQSNMTHIPFSFMVASKESSMKFYLILILNMGWATSFFFLFDQWCKSLSSGIMWIWVWGLVLDSSPLPSIIHNLFPIEELIPSLTLGPSHGSVSTSIVNSHTDQSRVDITLDLVPSLL